MYCIWPKVLPFSQFETGSDLTKVLADTDTLGTVITHLFFIFLFSTRYRVLLGAGLLLMTFSSPSMPVLIFPGMVCISIAGLQILLTNMQVCMGVYVSAKCSAHNLYGPSCYLIITLN